MSEAQKKWRRNNIDKARAASLRWNRENKERVALAKKKWRASSNGRYSNLISNAKVTGREVQITLEQWLDITSKPCTYCGGECLSELVGYGVDRIDSTKGYTLENSVPCCQICNAMKSNLELDLFLSHIDKVNKWSNTND